MQDKLSVKEYEAGNTNALLRAATSQVLWFEQSESQRLEELASNRGL